MHAHSPGQVLVELALALPVLLFMLLGAIECASLLTYKADQDHRTTVVAEWAAAHPSEPPGAVLGALRLDGCTVTVTPDDALGIVTADVSCPYSPMVTANLWDGLPVGSQASAATGPVVIVAGATATPEATP